MRKVWFNLNETSISTLNSKAILIKKITVFLIFKQMKKILFVVPIYTLI
uniref:Uncharacterized protein n=1 Tax=Arundo donax TaxID=35708 RepID=A0A0A9H6J3_ARUDO